MGSIRPTSSGRFELSLSHRLLPKRLFFTFDSKAEAETFGIDAGKWLKAGIVPAELTQGVGGRQRSTVQLAPLIQRWRNEGKLSKTDDEILGWLLSDKKVNILSLSDLSYAWVDSWVTHLKLDRNLAPSTIRQRVQALSRAMDWHIRVSPTTTQTNPFKLLPRGYSIYSETDAAALQIKGKDSKRDVVRDRRLNPGEEARIRATLAGEKRADRERALDSDIALIFEVILQTGIRLREAYTLRKENVMLDRRVLKIQTTKQRNGNIVFREVPMRPVLHAALAEVTGTGLLFDFWDGDNATLKKATARLSHRFTSLFEYAKCPDMREHDLRHEATCRWFEQRDSKGNWMFRAAEINRIMGWSGTSAMSVRYASFRSESLADRLWE